MLAESDPLYQHVPLHRTRLASPTYVLSQHCISSPQAKRLRRKSYQLKSIVRIRVIGSPDKTTSGIQETQSYVPSEKLEARCIMHMYAPTRPYPLLYARMHEDKSRASRSPAILCTLVRHAENMLSLSAYRCAHSA